MRLANNRIATDFVRVLPKNSRTHDGFDVIHLWRCIRATLRIMRVPTVKASLLERGSSLEYRRKTCECIPVASS